jgi:hypothetical protein
MFNHKNDCVNRQQSHSTKQSDNCFNSTTITTTITTLTTTTAANTTHLTNPVTSSSLILKPSSVLPLQQSQPLLFHQHQHQHQSKLHSLSQLQQYQQSSVQQHQSLIKAVTIQSCNHSPVIQTYGTCLPTSEPYSQSVYQHNVTQKTMMSNPYSVQGSPNLLKNRKDAYNQNHIYANYMIPMQHPSITQSGVNFLL